MLHAEVLGLVGNENSIIFSFVFQTNFLIETKILFLESIISKLLISHIYIPKGCIVI